MNGWKLWMTLSIANWVNKHFKHTFSYWRNFHEYGTHRASASNVQFKGKYSFQYVKNARFDHCSFDTKDAFWHSEGVTVTNSIVRGEYLAWYSQGLTLIRCKIIGTQPLCYCKGLKLINCEMVDTGLSFEKSEVEAVITTPIVSVKNPRSGTITAPSVGEIIMDDPEAQGKVLTCGQTGSAFA